MKNNLSEKQKLIILLKQLKALYSDNDTQDEESIAKDKKRAIKASNKLKSKD